MFHLFNNEMQFLPTFIFSSAIFMKGSKIAAGSMMQYTATSVTMDSLLREVMGPASFTGTPPSMPQSSLDSDLMSPEKKICLFLLMRFVLNPTTCPFKS